MTVQNQHQQGAPLPPGYGPENPLSTGPFPPAAIPLGPPPSEDGWGKVGVLMVMLALVFAGGVAYFIASAESSEAEAGSVATADSEDPATLAGAAQDGEDGEAKPLGEEDEETKDDDEPAEAEKESAAAAIAGTAVENDGGPSAEGAEEAETDEPTDKDELLRANGEVDRPTGLVSMSIESEPAGAQVIRKKDGVRLGVTPYRYEVEAAGGNVTFILKLEGYRSKSIQIPTNRDSVRQVMLFPGKGGDPIPEPAPAPATADKDKTKVVAASKTEPAAKKTTESKPKTADKAPVKTATVKKPRTKKRRPKKPPRKRDRPKKSSPKKSGGTVDYTAVPIPLD